MDQNVILIVIAAGIAFYLGYRMGRMSVLVESNGTRPQTAPDIETADASPLPGPGSVPSRPRAAPPPASAGGGEGRSAGPSASSGSPPRRTAAPPPARAGLLDKDQGSRK